MGVTRLWLLLKEKGEGEETSLSGCGGQSWAVDLSGWILHARTASTGIAGFSADNTMIKTVFYRALCLMKHGIRPVFVMDGRMAPEIKSQTMQDRSERVSSGTKRAANDRSGLLPMNKKCQEMLEALGLQVICSSGEAEKTCALLNRHGIVDACLSDDSDCFLYGASTVYRNLDLNKETAEKHTSSGIEEKLTLNRRDLVVMALLSGCDYGDGVKGIGPKKVLELVTAIKKYSPDVLDRVCSWRDINDLDSMGEERQRMTKKTQHCTHCQHTGNKTQHQKAGCIICRSTTECSADSGRLCPCEYHAVKQRTDPYVEEMNLRQKAIKQDSFPNQKLIQEFLDDKQVFDVTEVRISLPTWDELAAYVSFSHRDLMKKLVPVLVHMHLHGTLQLSEAAPDSILKDCKRNSVQCYLVTWKQFAFDRWTPELAANNEQTPTRNLETNNPYVVAVPCKPFEDKYPDLVSGHKLSISKKKAKGPCKRKQPKQDSSQGKLTDYFKAKKRLHFEDDEQK